MEMSYNCTALMGSNKVGKLTPDSSGYYEMILGAFDFFNGSGEYYPFTRAKELFAESSSTMRRIANGQCRGEYGHPKKAPGSTNHEFLSRILSIDEGRISHHIKSVRIDSSSVKNDQGKPVIAVIGMVKPCGPMGDVLKAQLDNPDENVAFSIRSLTDNQIVGGTRHKHVKTIVTWDYVNEPGISVANKYQAPSLESLNQNPEIFIPGTLDSVEHSESGTLGALESNGIDITMLRSELGWSRVQNLVQASRSW